LEASFRASSVTAVRNLKGLGQDMSRGRGDASRQIQSPSGREIDYIRWPAKTVAGLRHLPEHPSAVRKGEQGAMNVENQPAAPYRRPRAAARRGLGPSAVRFRTGCQAESGLWAETLPGVRFSPKKTSYVPHGTHGTVSLSISLPTPLRDGPQGQSATQAARGWWVADEMGADWGAESAWFRADGDQKTLRQTMENTGRIGTAWARFTTRHGRGRRSHPAARHADQRAASPGSWQCCRKRGLTVHDYGRCHDTRPADSIRAFGASWLTGKAAAAFRGPAVDFPSKLRPMEGASRASEKRCSLIDGPGPYVTRHRPSTAPGTCASPGHCLIRR